MKANHSILLTIVCTLLIGIGCRNTKPQLPSNKVKRSVDTTLVSMIAFNQTMAEKADSELARYVAESGTKYVREDLGYWHLMVQRTNNARIVPKQSIEVHYTVFKLDTTMCQDVRKEIEVGKKELPRGIEEMLLTMRLGEKAELLLPWYLAYGPKGDDQTIEGYEAVRIELEIIK